MSNAEVISGQGQVGGGASKKPTRGDLLWLGLTVLVLFPFITLLHGWVLTVLWGWFVVPQFGVATLSLPTAVGLDILFDFLAYKHSQLPSRSEGAGDKEVSWAEKFRRAFVPSFSLSLLRPGVTLAFGWVFHLFVRHLFVGH